MRRNQVGPDQEIIELPRLPGVRRVIIAVPAGNLRQERPLRSDAVNGSIRFISALTGGCILEQQQRAVAPGLPVPYIGRRVHDLMPHCEQAA
ncbi:hypothetical protein D3C71_1529570 [compost metagenome]